MKKYGTASWELDALEPRVLDKLITDTILKYLDLGEFNKIKSRQDQEREKLLNIDI